MLIVGGRSNSRGKNGAAPEKFLFFSEIFCTRKDRKTEKTYVNPITNGGGAQG